MDQQLSLQLSDTLRGLAKIDVPELSKRNFATAWWCRDSDNDLHLARGRAMKEKSKVAAQALQMMNEERSRQLELQKHMGELTFQKYQVDRDHEKHEREMALKKQQFDQELEKHCREMEFSKFKVEMDYKKHKEDKDLQRYMADLKFEAVKYEADRQYETAKYMADKNCALERYRRDSQHGVIRCSADGCKMTFTSSRELSKHVRDCHEDDDF